MEHYIIGIDAGAKGGICVIDMCSEKIVNYYFYNLETYKMFFKMFRPATLYIEQVHSMPHDGKKQAFSFGFNYGVIQGLAMANGCKIVEVPPQKWKKYYGLDKDKKKSIELAKKLYKGIDLNIGKRKVIESDGMAEAILIARYGMEVNENESK